MVLFFHVIIMVLKLLYEILLLELAKVLVDIGLDELLLSLNNLKNLLHVSNHDHLVCIGLNHLNINNLMIVAESVLDDSLIILIELIFVDQ